jgi:hypothetical protein
MRIAMMMSLALTGSAMLGCGFIPGFGDKEEAQPALQPTAMPMQPGVPGQPAAMQPGMPAQPGMMPAQPGMVPAQPGMMPAQPGKMPGTAPVAVPTPPVPTGDALTDALNSKKFQVAAEWQPTSALSKGRLEKGAKQAYQVQLPGPPFCHTYVAVADAGISNLDLSLSNAAGAVMTQDSTSENSATVLNSCPPMAGLYTVTVSATAGAGEFAVQVFSK